MRIIRDDQGNETQRIYDKFEVFKEERGPGYGLYGNAEDGWYRLIGNNDYHPLQATADFLNMEWARLASPDELRGRDEQVLRVL